MEIEFNYSKKVNGKYTPEVITESPKKVLKMQALPAGCFVVGIAESEGEEPDSIISIDAALFIALCEFEHKKAVVTCYGIQDPSLGSIVWRNEAEVEIYCYGPYKQTCELIGETPVPFLKWYQNQRKGYFSFDIPLIESEEQEQMNKEAE